MFNWDCIADHTDPLEQERERELFDRAKPMVRLSFHDGNKRRSLVMVSLMAALRTLKLPSAHFTNTFCHKRG